MYNYLNILKNNSVLHVTQFKGLGLMLKLTH